MSGEMSSVCNAVHFTRTSQSRYLKFDTFFSATFKGPLETHAAQIFVSLVVRLNILLRK